MAFAKLTVQKPPGRCEILLKINGGKVRGVDLYGFPAQGKAVQVMAPAVKIRLGKGNPHGIRFSPLRAIFPGGKALKENPGVSGKAEGEGAAVVTPQQGLQSAGLVLLFLRPGE